MMIGGVGLALLAIAGFLFAIFNRVDQLTLHFLSTAPMVLAFGLLGGGWSLRSGPYRVTLDDDGIEMESRDDTKRCRWSEIGWATLTATGMGHRKQLLIYDTSGKQVAALTEAIENFDELAATVKSNVSEQQAPGSNEVQLRKARKSAIFMASVASAMLLLSGALAWITYEDQRSGELLRSSAVEGTATIDRLFLAPNGVTTRVEYTVENKAGETGSRNAELDPRYYQELEASDAHTIPVLYVENEPTISRLQDGEIVEQDFLRTPIGGYGLSGLVAVLCIGFLGVAALQWRGWDIDLDSKTGKMSIKRFGEGV